jgi:hypothetical protein
VLLVLINVASAAGLNKNIIWGSDDEDAATGEPTAGMTVVFTGNPKP